MEPCEEAQEYREKIKGILDRYKGKDPPLPVQKISILNKKELRIAFLRPITADFRVSLPGVEKLIAKWRNESSGLSEKPFTATPAETARWLDGSVIGREDRILFLIELPDGTPVGQIGYATFNFNEKSCEVDSVLRADQNACPGIMGLALKTLIKWGRSELGLQVIRLHVFQNNLHAISFYLKNGFIIEREERAKKTSVGKSCTIMRYQPELKM